MLGALLTLAGAIAAGAAAIDVFGVGEQPDSEASAPTGASSEEDGPTFWEEAKSDFQSLVQDLTALTRDLDEKYQTFMTERFDTLMGATRQEQLNTVISNTVISNTVISNTVISNTAASTSAPSSAEVSAQTQGLSAPESADGAPDELSSQSVLEITPYERDLNHSLLSSSVMIGSGIVGSLLFPPAQLLSLGLGLYTSRFFLKRAYEDVVQEKQVTGYVLGSLNTLGILLSGNFVIGGTFTLLFSLGDKLILITRNRSHKSLINVFEKPKSVLILVDNEEREIAFEALQPGDQLMVRAGQTIPVDGIVLEGAATIDQHVLTGEAQPAEKGVGDAVLAATVVLTGKIRVRVEHSGENSVAAQISHILNNTAGHQLALKQKSEQLADQAVLPTLLLGALALPVAGYQSMIAIWGTSIGFNMRITGPIAMLNFLRIASEHGILVKDGRSLELLHEVDVIIFDKTGTLTQEQPQLANVHLCDSVTADELLSIAAAAETHQTHPIARAILAEAKRRGLTLPEIDHAHIEVGYGIKVEVSGRLVHVGSDRYMRLNDICIPDEILALQETGQDQGHSLVMVAIDAQLVGAIELQPTIRPEAADVVSQLHQYGLEVMVISGDQECPTRKLTQQLGIDRYFANTLPAQKASLVEQLQAEGHTVCYVGDGINDSIALRKANVSVSLRGASTAAIDTAQIILTEESLHKLPFLLKLGRKFDTNMKAGFVTSIVPGASIIAGGLLLKLGLTSALGIWVVSFLANLGIAMRPLVDEELSGKPLPEPLEAGDEETKVMVLVPELAR